MSKAPRSGDGICPHSSWNGISGRHNVRLILQLDTILPFPPLTPSFFVFRYWTESGHDVTTFSICATHFQLVYVFFQIPFPYPAFIQMSTGPLGFVSGFFFDIL